MSDIVIVDRYGPDTPWATHSWTDDPYWGDSCWFCAACDVPSYRGEAHAPCPGMPGPTTPRLPTSVLVQPRAA